MQTRKTSPFFTVGTVAIAAALVFMKKDAFKYSRGLLDEAMLVAFFVLMVWLLLPRRDKPAGHEDADQGFALRLGKSLKRIRRPSKG